jgi:hypothetical protein
MIGEKIGEESGRIIGQRVLPNPGGGVPHMETSFRATGTLLGVNHTSIVTYASHIRPDGTVYGAGEGLIMGAGGEQATLIGSGVGTLKKDGSISYRGAVYYNSASQKWARLNNVAAVFEYEVDAQGNTHSQIWEWK